MNPAIARNLIPARSPTRRRRWPWIIVGLLAAHTTLMIVFVVIATRDKSFSVDPDYYGKAVHWDDLQAQQRASDALGWHAILRPEESTDTNGARTIVLELTDSAGSAIPATAVEATYFHHAHGDQVRKVAFAPSASDARQFAVRAPMSHPGMWEFHVTARAGDRLFVKTLTVDAK